MKRAVHDVPVRPVSTDELQRGDMVLAVYGEGSLDVTYLVLQKELLSSPSADPVWSFKLLSVGAFGIEIEEHVEPGGTLFAFAGIVFPATKS
jgi:hypothetical protein